MFVLAFWYMVTDIANNMLLFSQLNCNTYLHKQNNNKQTYSRPSNSEMYVQVYIQDINHAQLELQLVIN